MSINVTLVTGYQVMNDDNDGNLGPKLLTSRHARYNETKQKRNST